ncbi:MAG: hypothetical protein A3J76_00080 [Candidatus Moranbacteria bacterium RBG_13_45_13]|nr:MAG: hypothetical protein A3J76_00080 [Candidatus Moranbacteria bacterium RBG_13_45_13]
MAVRVYNLTEKIFKDERGWVANLAEYATEKGYVIENIHLAPIKPGQIRGNHFHKKQKEWIFVFGGKGIFSWKEQGVIKKQEIETGSQYLFEIDPECPHAIKNTSNKDIYLCAFTDSKYNLQNPDSVLEKVI